MTHGIIRFWLTNLVSAAAGYIAELPLHGAFGKRVLALFATAFRIDLTEAELPLDQYRSMGDLFARRLRPGARPIHGDLVAPCDGRIRSAGSLLERDSPLAVKGRGYSVAKILQDETLAARYGSGSALNIYLAPHNYHRVHAPVAGIVREVRYIPGSLWPVNEFAFQNIDGLLASNERAIIPIETANGIVSVIMIGATNVGRIDLSRFGLDADAMLRFKTKTTQKITLSSPVQIQAGDDLGAFRLGSSVVVLFETAHVFCVKPGDALVMGQAIC